ncbi:MAG: regulatory iron-sulfur-containing complex subunit RicT [Candidatus Sericytochromatia bacterium]
MAKLGVRLNSGELRILDGTDSFQVKDNYVIFEDDESILNCIKATPLPSTLIIERGNIKTVKFIREANNSDKKQLLNKKEEEDKAYKLCYQKINTLNLPMRLIDAVYTFDFNRLTFFYYAEDRVDFRGLLKELTANFRRTRIILRQIGAREEARMLNGVGTCGRTLCCSTWLKEFPFVTTKMAKNQSLPSNPSKLTGMCGKLKCCLSYEDQMYEEEKVKLPALDSYVETNNGIGKVIKILILEGKVEVKNYEKGTLETIKADEIKAFNVPSPENVGLDFSALDEL